MKKITSLLTLVLCIFHVNAQQALTPDVLKTLSDSFEKTSTNRALRNAISANSLRSLALNQEHTATPDTWFNVEVNSSGITDQQSSGRCWLFTGTNVIRARLMADLGISNFHFSHVYLFFYDQLEKSNLFLQGIIDTRKKPMDDKMVEWLFRNPLSDGGQFTGIADLIQKYGLVPKDVMAETYNSDNTAELTSLMKRKLREFGLLLRQQSDEGAPEKTLEKNKVEMLKTIYRMLVLGFGEPPTSFTWAPKKNGKNLSEPKTYTPQSFYKEVCKGENIIENHVMLMNDPSREYHQVYEIDFDRHTYDGHNWVYINLPIDELKSIAIASLKDSCMMYFSCDVGKHLNKKNGMLDLKNYDYESMFGTTFGMNKKQRIQSFDSGSSHAMTLVAVDLDENGTSKKWKVENSWGPSYGHNGFLIMTDEWFNEYMFRVVAHKKYCPKKVLDILKQKPIRLPAWDPMFANEM